MPHKLTDDTVCALAEGHAGEHEPRRAEDFVQDFGTDEHEERDTTDDVPDDEKDVPDADDTDDAEPQQQYDDMTYPQLQDELRKRGLPVSGSKDDLVTRLRESDLNDD